MENVNNGSETISLCLCWRHHWRNVKLDINVDFKCEGTLSRLSIHRDILIRLYIFLLGFYSSIVLEIYIFSIRLFS